MRASTLQYLYLQKPVTMVVVICIISLLPWIGLDNFSTQGVPAEGAVAASMLADGNWILPLANASDIPYTPPMSHWLTALFSCPQGYVSPLTFHLPPALLYIVMMACVLLFFGKRIVKFQEAFIATLLLITCFGVQKTVMMAHADMIFSAFIVLSLIQLYRWEEKLELKGLPIIIPILLGCAVLTKGLAGILLPLFVFGAYLLLLRKYSSLTVFKALLYIGVSTMFLPLLWYVSAWKQEGGDFLRSVLTEELGRFFHLSAPGFKYSIIGGNNVPSYLTSLVIGFTPWILFFLFSLVGLRLNTQEGSITEQLKAAWNRVRTHDPIRLFSLTAIVGIGLFYLVPFGQHSVYPIPAYPFIALFFAQYVLYVTEYRTKVTRTFAAIVASMVTVLIVAVVFSMMKAIHLVSIASLYTSEPAVLEAVSVVTGALSFSDVQVVSILLFIVPMLGCVFYWMFKKINIKILYATIALIFAANLLISGIIMRNIW